MKHGGDFGIVYQKEEMNHDCTDGRLNEKNLTYIIYKRFSQSKCR